MTHQNLQYASKHAHAGDTQSRIFTRNLTVYHAFLYKFLLVQKACIKQKELYSTQETCRYMTKLTDVIGRLVC